MQILDVQAGHVPIFELMPLLKAKQKKWKKQAAGLAATEKAAEKVGGGGGSGPVNSAAAKEHRQALGDRNWVGKSLGRYLATTVREGRCADADTPTRTILNTRRCFLLPARG